MSHFDRFLQMYSDVSPQFNRYYLEGSVTIETMPDDYFTTDKVDTRDYGFGYCGLIIDGQTEAINDLFSTGKDYALLKSMMVVLNIPVVEILDMGIVHKTVTIFSFYKSCETLLDYMILSHIVFFVKTEGVGIMKDDYHRIMSEDGFGTLFEFEHLEVSFNKKVIAENSDFVNKKGQIQTLEYLVVNIWTSTRWLVDALLEEFKKFNFSKPVFFKFRVGSQIESSIVAIGGNYAFKHYDLRSSPQSINFTSYLKNPMNQINLEPFNTSIPELGRATFPEFFQFLSEESQKGRFWMIFDNLTDRCLFLTDNAEPGRLTLPTHQYVGLDRFETWRDSMSDYERLQQLLKAEKIAPSFEFNCYRADNSFCHFQKSSYLIEGLWGTQCRASVSEGWELVRPAPIK